MTSTYYAAWRGKLESIRYLCEHGADVNATNNRSETPLDNVTYNTVDVQDYLRTQAIQSQVSVLGDTNEVMHTTDYNIRKTPFYQLPYIVAIRQCLSYTISILFRCKKERR